MPDLESTLRHARPEWPEPPDALEAQILGALAPVRPMSPPQKWLRRAPRSRRFRLIAVGVVLAGSGAALAAAIAVRSGGADPGVPASLSVDGAERVAHIGGFLQSPPAIAADATGTVSLAWARAGRVVATSRPRSGVWSPEQPLSDRAVRANQPRLAAGTAGTVAVWRERVLGREVSRSFTLPGGRPAGALVTHLDVRWRIAASSRDSTGRWSAPVTISPEFGGIRDAYAPALVMTGGGGAFAGYAAGGRAWSVRSTGLGKWQQPQPISRGAGRVSGLTLAAAPRTGWAVATWIARSDDAARGRLWQLFVARSTPGGAWEEPTAVTEPSPAKPLAQAAINDEGEAVVGWTDGGTNAATHDRTGSWSSPARIAESPGANYILDGPPAGIDGEGRALVSIVTAKGALVARRERGGEWQPSSPLAPRGRVLSVSGDAAGGLVIVALTSGRTSTVIRLDRAGAESGTSPLRGLGFPLGVGVGADGTTAFAGSREVRDTTDLVVGVAEGRGHP